MSEILKQALRDLCEDRNRKDELLTSEREKRITLERLPPECEGCKPSKIKQGFVKEVRNADAPHCDVRIRNQEGRYTMTAKFRPKMQEATTKISKDMFESLWPATHSKQEKVRYNLENGWIVDDIKKPQPKIVAEYEYKEEEGRKAAHMPKGFKKKES